MKRLLVTVAAALGLSAQAQAQVRPQTAGKTIRGVINGDWKIVRTIGLDSELFEQPSAMAAMGERFVVVDGDVIHSFRTTGAREWSFGRTGSGPGEFHQILSIAVDASGNTLVYDGAVDRLTIVDSVGKLRGVVPLASRTDRAASSEIGRYLLLNTASDTLTRVVDSLGRVSRTERMPPELRTFEGISREASSVLPVRGGYVVTFRWSSRMLALSRDGAVTGTCTGIDSLSYPDAITRAVDAKVEGFKNLRSTRVEPNARPAAIRATLLGPLLLIEPSVKRSHTHVLDAYSGSCGKYLGSRPFPFPATLLAGTHDLLVVMLDEPVPHVAILRWVAK
jgi:hypothetical protein